MPNPLPEEYERITWRMWAADMDTLRLLFPGRVNEVAREVFHQYCERIRSGLKAQQNQSVSDAAAADRQAR